MPKMPRRKVARAATKPEEAKRASRRPPVPKPAPGRKPSPSRRGSTRTTPLVIRGLDPDVEFRIPTAIPLEQLAIEWNYVLQNRHRWSGREATVAEQAADSQDQLKGFGMSDDFLRRLAGAGLVEVSFPHQPGGPDREARTFPWEYMLCAATRDIRRGRALTVTRHLHRPERPAARAPKKLLLVESAPCGLRDSWEFESERRLLGASLELTTGAITIARDPTREQLVEMVARTAPDVIHLTGFDTLQGMELLEMPVDGKEGEIPDGFLLAAADGRPDFVPATVLARLLNKGRVKPLLVSCNLLHSAAGLAASCVAEGAGAAIGFQDEFDNSAAEMFFTTFYRTWRLADWTAAAAFQATWQDLRSRPVSLQGTGIVLWNSSSLREMVAAPRGRARAPARAGEAPARAALPGEAIAGLEETVRRARSTPLLLDGTAPVSELLEVEIKPLDTLNYSLLHNGRRLFETFILRKYRPGCLDEVSVAVELNVGAERAPWRMTFSMDQAVMDLRDQVRLPLTWALGRSIRESVRTSLLVQVSVAGREIVSRSFWVTLLPANEWRDDDADRVWLPSFVLPRDPIIPHIVDSAHRYLMTLLDDCDAGFDGYQSVDPGAADPSEGVDLQVQALWAALLHETPLSYINPPPTYTASSQRLRTPSEIRHGRQGTCIDLALLVASLLEYVDIYPAIILLEGHAFPAYWRREGAPDAFGKLQRPPAPAEAAAGAVRPATVHVPEADNWRFGREHFGRVIEKIQARELVPLETVGLTRHGSFARAIEEGMQDLRNAGEFQALIDVIQARRFGVTPLPVREEER